MRISSAVSPMPQTTRSESATLTCTKEKVYKVSLAALFFLGGVFLIGLGLYSYTHAQNATISGGLIVGGSLCFIAVCVVVICMPLSGLVDTVNRLGGIVTQADTVNQTLARQNQLLTTSMNRLEAQEQLEQRNDQRVQEQINGLKGDLKAASDLLKAEKDANQQLKQFQKVIDPLLTAIQGIDKDDATLNKLIADCKGQIGAMSQKINDATKTTTTNADHLDQENSELANTTKQLGEWVTQISQNIAKKQQAVADIDKMITQRKQIDDELLAKTGQLTAARQALDETTKRLIQAKQDLAQIDEQAAKLLEQLKSRSLTSDSTNELVQTLTKIREQTGGLPGHTKQLIQTLDQEKPQGQLTVTYVPTHAVTYYN